MRTQSLRSSDGSLGGAESTPGPPGAPGGPGTSPDGGVTDDGAGVCGTVIASPG